ncbi:uncharacterized protein LOC141629676 [Silene latifolia]|uniref:uncharacterized protein LOC141629676 n=1 Tax=Silene latifolia TaxID=37657 RepID=UPI003D783084
MSEAKYIKLMVKCWALWEHRNKDVFDNSEEVPESIIRRVRDVVDERAVGEGVMMAGGTSRRRTTRDGSEDGEEGWRAAKYGFVKINVDAGVKGGEGVRTGAVCRDVRGEVLWGLSIGRALSWKVHVAEAVAVLDGLEEGVARGIQKVELESDCLQVIDAIKGKKQGRSMFLLVIEDIMEISYKFQSIILSYTHHDNNCVAHELAHCIPSVIHKVV